MSVSLAQRLRLGTSAVHSMAERAGVMAQLIDGRLSHREYVVLLRNLWEIYDALEVSLQHHRLDPWIAPILKLQLQRTDRLRDDLIHLHGPGWRAELPVTAAARAYRDRLELLGEQRPTLLVAHAYVRYLGDLHGGQMLGQIVSRTLGVSIEQGAAFYYFSGPQSVGQLIRDYRIALDSLPCSDALGQEMVSEAQDAFHRHVVLFEEIASTA